MSHESSLAAERARELLPWLLNGTLEDGERRDLLAALRRSPELRRELADTHWAGRLFAHHLPTADVVAYALAEVTATDRALVESHLASCTDCRDELEMVRESLAARGADSPAAVVVPFGRRPAPSPVVGVSPVWRMAALAAGLIAVLGVGGWLNTWQQAMSRNQDLTARIEARSDQVADLATSLGAAATPPSTDPDLLVGRVAFPSGTVRAGGGGPRPLVLSSLDGTVELRFQPQGEAGAPVHEVRLLQAEDGTELLRITPLLADEDDIVRAQVAADLLPQGVMVAVLLRADPELGWRELERHEVEVSVAG